MYIHTSSFLASNSFLGVKRWCNELVSEIANNVSWNVNTHYAPHTAEKAAELTPRTTGLVVLNIVHCGRGRNLLFSPLVLSC